MARGPGKGNTNNPSGRPVGTKNKRTKEWEALGESILSEHTAKFNEILRDRAENDSDTFIELYLKIIEYFRPKMARIENTHDTADNVKSFEVKIIKNGNKD